MKKYVAAMLVLVTAGEVAVAQEAAPVSATHQSGAAQSADGTAATPAPASSDVIEGIVPAAPADKGQVVFFRKGGLFGAAISCAVHEKGEKLSSLPPGKYNVQIAEPGIHEYSVKSEATDTLRLEVEAGETYFAQCNVTMGVMAGRPNLSPSDRATFLNMSKKLKPAVNKPERTAAR